MAEMGRVADRLQLGRESTVPSQAGNREKLSLGSIHGFRWSGQRLPPFTGSDCPVETGHSFITANCPLIGRYQASSVDGTAAKLEWEADAKTASFLRTPSDSKQQVS